MKIEEIVSKVWGPEESADYHSKDSPPGSREKILDLISKNAYNSNRAYEGCTRCVLIALQRELNLPNTGEAIKASTGLAAGVARMGETCGALLGGIMALGLCYGSQDLSDFDSYVKTMEVSKDLFSRFESELGTTKCSRIQKKLLGREIDFFKEEDRDFWYKNGGLEVCPWVCSLTARITGDLILADK